MSDAARELVLWAENDSGMYRMRKPYLENMRKKMRKGTYSVDLGIKLWTYYATLAAKNYAREFGSMSQPWSKMFSTKDRREAAEQFEKDARRELRDEGVGRDASRSRKSRQSAKRRAGAVKVRSYKVKSYKRKAPKRSRRK
jgi:hypothetical protein